MLIDASVVPELIEPRSGSTYFTRQLELKMAATSLVCFVLLVLPLLSATYPEEGNFIVWAARCMTTALSFSYFLY